MAVRILRGSWWVDFRFSQTRYRKRSPEDSRAGAQVFEVTLRQRLARGEPIDGLQSQLYPAFSEFSRQWLRDYVRPNNKQSEQLAKKYNVESSLMPFFGSISVDKISAHDIERYKAQQVKAGYSNKTIRN